jgi:DnaJ-class molecular chaperone
MEVRNTSKYERKEKMEVAKQICSECGGNGHLSLIVTCDKCGGDGEIVQPDGTIVDCGSCINGNARIYPTCEKCNGTGYVNA